MAAARTAQASGDRRKTPLRFATWHLRLGHDGVTTRKYERDACEWPEEKYRGRPWHHSVRRGNLIARVSSKSRGQIVAGTVKTGTCGDCSRLSGPLHWRSLMAASRRQMLDRLNFDTTEHTPADEEISRLCPSRVADTVPSVTDLSKSHAIGGQVLGRYFHQPDCSDRIGTCRRQRSLDYRTARADPAGASGADFGRQRAGATSPKRTGGQREKIGLCGSHHLYGLREKLQDTEAPFVERPRHDPGAIPSEMESAGLISNCRC